MSQLRVPDRIVGGSSPLPGRGPVRTRWWYALIAGCALIALLAGLQLAAEIRSWMDSGLGSCGCRPLSTGGAVLGRGGAIVLGDAAVILVAGLGAALARRRLRPKRPSPPGLL